MEGGSVGNFEFSWIVLIITETFSAMERILLYNKAVYITTFVKLQAWDKR